MFMTTKPIDLFRRNGVISKDGQIGGVLEPPPATRLPGLQAELAPLLKEAERRKVMFRLGVLEAEGDPVLVYAIDVGGPHDTHKFISRLATILTRHGAQPLDLDLDTELVIVLTSHLVSTSLT